jgi:hypothetical protein
MVYNVYANEVLVHWPRAKIFGHEISMYGLLPAAVKYANYPVM